MNRTLLPLVAAFGLLLTAGCALLGGGKPEPEMIVLRNATGLRVTQVMMWPLEEDNENLPPIAAVDSVPRSQSAVMRRWPNSSPLPKMARVAWVDARDRTRAKDVDLASALENATGKEGEILVLEIDRSHKLSATIGRYK